MRFILLIWILLSFDVFSSSCNIHSCSGEEHEKKLLQKWSEVFSREGENLKFQLKDGGEVRLQNDHQTAGSVTYEIAKYWKELDYVVIVERRYMGENTSTFLYSLKNAQQFSSPYQIDGWPVLSPDKKRLAVFGFDIEAGWSFNGIAIYNIENKPQLEIKIGSDRWGIEELVWKDTNHIIIKQAHCYEVSEKSCTKNQELILIKNEWTLKNK